MNNLEIFNGYKLVINLKVQSKPVLSLNDCIMPTYRCGRYINNVEQFDTHLLSSVVTITLSMKWAKLI